MATVGMLGQGGTSGVGESNISCPPPSWLRRRVNTQKNLSRFPRLEVGNSTNLQLQLSKRSGKEVSRVTSLRVAKAGTTCNK